MSENTLRRTDEIRAASRLDCQPHNEGSGVGQGDLRGNLGSATQRWALQMKEEKHAPKEAFDPAAFARFFLGPSRRQAGTVFPASRIPGNDGYSSNNAMNPSNEAQAPIRCVQADDTRTDLVEAHGPRSQSLCKRGIV